MSKIVDISSMTRDEIDAERDRRLQAYLKLLEDVYQTDGYGIGEMIGYGKSRWTYEINAPWGNKGFVFICELCQLAGLSVDWLCMGFQGMGSRNK